MEIIYTGRQNSIDFGILLNKKPVSAPNPLNATNRLRLLVVDKDGDQTVFDSQANPAYFATSKRRMVNGQMVNVATLILGAAGLAVGQYEMTLTVFDATYTTGVAVGQFSAEVRAS
jgi:hypothetical protein